MRRRLLLVFWLAILASISTLVWAEWRHGTVHGHSLNSDGTRTASQVIGKAKATGDEFLIQTDHYDVLVKAPTKALDEWHMKVYRDGFTTNKLVCLVGAEFAARHGKSNAHILGFGPEIRADDILSKLNGKQGVQQQLIDRLEELGFLAVAAHPSQQSTTNHLFDWGNARGLDGVEFFNDGSAEGYQKTLAQYLALISRGESLFVTAGCDQHTPADPDDKERWTRKTYVWIDGPLTKESLLEALRHGQTYAAQYGVRLTEINHIPARGSQVVDRPVISFRLEFGRPLRQAKLIRLYRDGMAVLEVICDAGQSSVSYTFDDKTAPKGQHSYILEVKGALITSSIHLSVRAETTEPAGTNKIPSGENDAGTAFPLLIGKKYNEVMGIIGEPKLPPNSSFSAFVSTRKYYPPYDLTVDFSGGRDEPQASQARLTVYGDDPQPDWRKADAVLPQSLLEARPSSMLLFENSKRLEITWQLNGATYAIAVLDPSGQLWSRIKVNGRVSYKLRGNWKAYPLKAFWQMSEKQDGPLWEMGGMAVEF